MNKDQFEINESIEKENLEEANEVKEEVLNEEQTSTEILEGEPTEQALIEETQLDGVKENDQKKEIKKSDKAFIIVSAVIIALLVTYLLLFSFVFFHVAVDGSSMMDTLESGDILIANKCKTPKYGDVIIVGDMKANGDWLIKRVVGLGGDTISIKDGDVYRNGELLEEDYAKGETYAPDCRDEGDIFEITYTVEEGEVFFLGDNREDSLDSRFYGKCTLDDVKGVVSEFSISIKGFTTAINRFSSGIKNFLGIKANGVQG